MMKKTAVISSNISSAGWDNNVMEVTFTSGGTYVAVGVPESEYKNLVSAKSAGKYFNSVLKKSYVWDKVG